MKTLNTDKTWIGYGKKDPYFGVLFEEKYLDKNLSQDSLTDFFLSGRKYVDNLFEIIHNQVDQNFKPNTALDFGCGTGRLIIPLAKRIEKVVGLDISKDILEIARINSEKNNLNNIRLYLSDNLSKITNQKFDMINSYIVFQHLNVNRGEKLIQLLLKQLNSNGICSLHLTYFKDKPKLYKIIYFLRSRIPFLHSFLNVLRGKSFKTPLMQMNTYNLNRIFQIIQIEGIKKCHVDYTNHGGELGVQLIFQKK